VGAVMEGSRSAGSEASPAAQGATVEFPSCAWLMEPVDVFVSEVAKGAGFDFDTAQDIQIAVHEAVINAIVHGNGDDPSRRVRLRVASTAAGLEVRVQDQGRGFDPEAVPDPLATDNLCRPCGRGIFFMRLLMDEVTFRPAADGGTEVILRKRRERPAARRPTPVAVAASCA